MKTWWARSTCHSGAQADKKFITVENAGMQYHPPQSLFTQYPDLQSYPAQFSQPYGGFEQYNNFSPSFPQANPMFQNYSLPPPYVGMPFLNPAAPQAPHVAPQIASQVTSRTLSQIDCIFGSYVLFSARISQRPTSVGLLDPRSKLVSCDNRPRTTLRRELRN